MIVVLLGIVASVVSALLGAGIGWFLQSHFSGAQLEIELAASKTQRTKDKTTRQEADNGRTAELMAKLAELTEGVATEVGKHSGNIEAINAELAAVKEGDTGAVVAAVKKILRANEQMQQDLQDAETRLQEQQQELLAQTEAARTDQLTKIINRRALDEELKRCVQEFQRSSQTFSLMIVDVDCFKNFNDTHGHLAGDEVLKYVAQTIKNQTRESELVARYGGEEFVVVFRGEGVADSRQRADELRASISERSIMFEGKELRVAASAGLAEIGIGEDEKGLIRRADEALYVSKKAGRNCAHWNDGAQNLPITPGLLFKRGAEAPVDAPVRPEVTEVETRRLDLYDIRFSDASFSPNLDRRVSEWKRTGHAFSLAICSIDGLETLRETHGEEPLRRIVSATANVISSCLRDMDQMAAFDEGSFAISLPTVQIQDAGVVADRMRRAVERLYVPDGDLPQFTVCVGVAQVIEGNDSSRLFDRAQRALEIAQEAEGNTTYIHDGLNPVPAMAATRQAAFA